nr:MAG TPA: HaeIII restriction endonuclease [Caudoviricetes sp.]
MHDTLNKPAKNKVLAITVPIVKLPTRLVRNQCNSMPFCRIYLKLT